MAPKEDERLPLIYHKRNTTHYHDYEFTKTQGNQKMGYPMNTCGIYLNKLRSIITVEPVFFLFTFGFYATIPAVQQYVYHVIAKEYDVTNLPANQSTCLANMSAEEKNLTQTIQSKTTEWMTWNNIVGTIPVIVSAMFLCSYSDTGGRKIVLVMTTVGAMLETLGLVVITSLHLNLNYILILSFLGGITGSVCVHIVVCHAYVADICGAKARSLRFLMLETLSGVAIALSQVVAGYFIEYQGYPRLFLFIFIIFASALILTISFVKETVEIKKSSFFSSEYAMKALRLYTTDSATWRRCRLVLGLSILLVAGCVNYGSADVLIYFIINYPLCFTPVLIGLLMGMAYFLRLLAGLSIIYLCKNVLLDSSWMFLGALSGVAGQLVTGLAVMPFVVFIGGAVGCLSVVVIPMVRSAASKLVSAEEQGAVLASIGLTQQISAVLGACIFNTVYAKTVQFNPSIVFLLTAAFYLVCAIISVVLFAREHHEETFFRHVGYCEYDYESSAPEDDQLPEVYSRREQLGLLDDI